MRRFPKTFLWASLSALCLVCPVSGGDTPHLAQTENITSASLEIHISPLRWENSCLTVGLDLINQSKVPVFLTVMGPYFDVALDVSKDDSSNHDDLEWVNVRGVSDIVSWDAEPLAPNSPSHKNYCIGEKVWVVNRQKETRREIPVRGRMRIAVSYFSTEDAWKRNKSWHDSGEWMKTSHNPWMPPQEIAPLWSTVIVDVPCPDEACKPDCDRSPRGFHGEGRMVPDVYFIDAEWSKRGEALTKDLEKKYPSCVEAK
jgi:hypothetical protein